MQYNAKTVLRLIPNETLARLFAPYPAFANFDWNAGSKGGADRVFERWQTMDDGDVRAVGRVLRQVHCLATPRGTRALIEAGRDQGLDLVEELAALGNAHERALACSLDHPEVFSAARILDHIEGLHRTSWEKRNGFPKQDLAAPEAMKAELGPRIGDYYRARDGRGAPCKVEHQKRNNGSHWFFAYPADYEDEVLGYDEAGELGRRPWSKAFEVVFIFDGAAETIDLYAQGGWVVRDELTGIFTEIAFGEAQESEPWKPAPYNLDLFKKSGVELPTKPEHHITSVRVKALRFEVHGAASGTITVDTGRSQKPVYELIRTHLAGETATLANVTIREVSLQVVFEPPGKRKRTVPSRSCRRIAIWMIRERRTFCGDTSRSGRLRSPAELWRAVVRRAVSGEPTFCFDEVREWPRAGFEHLVKLGILQEGPLAGSVVCDACGKMHREDVLWEPSVQDPLGKRAYIRCRSCCSIMSAGSPGSIRRAGISAVSSSEFFATTPRNSRQRATGQGPPAN